jgi:PKD repeat protein
MDINWKPPLKILIKKGVRMKRKHIVIISILAAAAIVISILAFPYFSSNGLLKQDNQSINIASKALILADQTSGNAPLTVNFKSVLQNFNDDAQYSWDFGDGEQSNEPSLPHIYHEVGDYHCRLTVKDANSESSDKLVISVRENNPPIIKIVVDKTSGNRPLNVNFDVDGFDTDGEIVSYEWEIQYPPFFSYQKISEHDEKNFSERFLRSGLYEVKLTVTDDAGKISTDYIKIQVLGHKIELLIGTSLYYLGIFDTISERLNNFFGRNPLSEPQTFIEKIMSFFEG